MRVAVVIRHARRLWAAAADDRGAARRPALRARADRHRHASASRRTGITVSEIEADGYPIAARVSVRRADQPRRGTSRATSGPPRVAFTDALAAARPDVLLVLGDRFEMLAAALAATGLRLPIAHLHGGELSEGSLDDATRHCITKLAHLHFVAARQYAERVCQLGEEPWRVHVVGAAGLESIRACPCSTASALAGTLALDGSRPRWSRSRFIPPRSVPSAPAPRPRRWPRASTTCSTATAPSSSRCPTTIPAARRSRAAGCSPGAAASTRVHAYASLGQLRYLSLLRHADAVVGNSSSALLEAPSFKCARGQHRGPPARAPACRPTC